MKHPIVIIGAGASGIGMGVMLRRLKLPFIILERGEIGESFMRWPKETQFISPSFTGNAFGAVDLNAVTPDTSPAFSLMSEHPTGLRYAQYLSHLSEHFKLPVSTGVELEDITCINNEFILSTSEGRLVAEYVIWAAGEFQYPNTHAIKGFNNSLHYANIDSWANLDGDEFSIIGGYESGVDAAYQLAKRGKKVTLFDGANQLKKHSSDSSYTLSPFTRDRLSTVATQIEIVNTRIQEIEKIENGFILRKTDNKEHFSPSRPINCTGFSSSLTLVEHLFSFNKQQIILNQFDESTIYPNIFLTGPQVRHEEAIFCFIYKYRQRFAVIGEILSKRLNGNTKVREEVINYYRDNNFYLDDFSCCDDECAC